ncbi:MAG: hypothetical protein ACRD1R_11370 [Acidobacteriota bacterium]
MKSFVSAILLIFLAAGCGIKKRTTLDVPPAYAQAQTASAQELIELINDRYAGVQTLKISRYEVEFEGGSLEQGYLERYPRAKGYLVAQRPESIFVNILNPLTSSTVATMAAQGRDFQIWLPRENKYVTGRTNFVTEEEKEPIYNVRPDHLLTGILIEPIPLNDPGKRYFIIEDQDLQTKYYVIGIIETDPQSQQAPLKRRLWIDRSSLALVRQHYYESGEVISSILYSRPFELNGMLVNGSVKIERPQENYSILLEYEAEATETNEPIRDDVFEVPVPPGAELVVLKQEETPQRP